MDDAVTDWTDVDAAIQKIRFELYRENIGGALELAEAAYAAHPNRRYKEQAERIRGWLTHLGGREAYIAAQEAQYRGLRWRPGLKLIEKQVRMWLGRKTVKLVRRRAASPEFRLLEAEVLGIGAKRIVDCGAGEGGLALALAARYPELRVDGVEVSRTNVRIARRLNRYSNAVFHEGLAEEVDRLFPPKTVDLVYSFAVLEHVRDVEATMAAMLRVLRPDGRLCFVVPMHEFRATGPLPDYVPAHGYADHCRVFTERELRERYGSEPGFALHKIPGRWKPGKFPDALEPVEFGSFFVAFSKR